MVVGVALLDETKEKLLETEDPLCKYNAYAGLLINAGTRQKT